MTAALAHFVPTAGVIGWPVAHSKSPLIHRFWLEKLGLDGDYSRFAVAGADLEQAVKALPALGFSGVNVTVPHKVSVLEHLDGLSAAARQVGAVNTIIVEAGGLRGHNTDVDGVLEALPAALLPAGAAVCLIGAGGAARAAMAAFSKRQLANVHLLVRSREKGGKLLADFAMPGQLFTLDAAAAAFQGVAAIVNATTLGMTGAATMPAHITRALEGAAPATTVMDMVYAPLETALLATARQRGLTTVDGLSMLIGQAASAFALLFGCAPPRQFDHDLRRLLLA